MFKQRVHFKNDRYEVELPWKRDSDELSDNFNLEKRRLGSPMRKMQSDKVLYSENCKVFRNYLDEGIIEKVKNPFISTNDPVLYFPHQVTKNESLTTKEQIVFDASACERKVLKDKMGSEKSDEDMELPQTTEKVLPLKSERAKMLSVGPDAVAQPVTVTEEKGLPRVLLISANEMYEETSVDVIKETAKEDTNSVVLSKEPVNLDEIEEVKQKVCFSPNLKASSNVIFVQHHWRKYSQVQREVEKPTRKLPFIQRPTVRKKEAFITYSLKLINKNQIRQLYLNTYTSFQIQSIPTTTTKKKREKKFQPGEGRKTSRQPQMSPILKPHRKKNPIKLQGQINFHKNQTPAHFDSRPEPADPISWKQENQGRERH
ncbi:splicing factor 3B subunit 2 [Trichonephila inaurata madagascariensis]|uniref:Splicing factor 3B subunit 2 n=1 Tax=Trichonephila inaurata madagascariensis TaxID=2747483 RepID=A0A8X7CEM8_9ARAC|nr:splicing factor 3B subunit 2 [Trichonephila inaurata madagascariensis]